MSHVHFIGIGGARMSALAQVMLHRGHTVSGSDPAPGPVTARLEAAGARVFVGQRAANITERVPDVVVTTDAIAPDNPELVAARESGARIVPGAQMLGTLMAESTAPRIAIAGTHGKTTTTSMTASALLHGGLDPTIFIGADYAGIGGNLHLGAGDGFLTEACEAYRSFLHLRPDVAVVTNVDHDHTDCYPASSDLADAFVEFASALAPSGLLVYCRDDAGAAHLAGSLGAGGGHPRCAAYGIGAPPAGTRGADLYADELRVEPGGISFRVTETQSGGPPSTLGRVTLGTPGEHNVRNALAALCVALDCGVGFDAAAEALAAFHGAERRFETLGDARGIRVLDDYAHHPTAIRATIAAARASFPERRLVVAFQPHLYSRTRDFMVEFSEALAAADAIVLTDIYAAREDPIPGVSVPDMIRRIAELAPDRTALYVPDRLEVADALLRICRAGDVVIVMGAGNIRPAGEALVEALRK